MKIRLPSELKEKIEEASKEAGRSMNAEITSRLEGSFESSHTTEEQAFQEGFELASLRIENARLKEQIDAERMEFFKSHQSADTVGKLLNQLPAELVSQYGLHLYESELDKALAELEKVYDKAGPANAAHQELLKSESPPGPVGRSSEKFARMDKRIYELKEQIHLLKQFISGIHAYRKSQGLKELRNVTSVAVLLETKWKG